MMNALGRFTPREPKYDAGAGAVLTYTESPVWRFEASATDRHDEPLPFDVTSDPGQEIDLAGEGRDAEKRVRSLLVDALTELEAPDKQFERLGLSA